MLLLTNAEDYGTKMNEHDRKLTDVLLDSLMLHWEDNGNVSADSVRDGCITVLAEVLEKNFAEIMAMVEKRIEGLQ